MDKLREQAKTVTYISLIFSASSFVLLYNTFPQVKHWTEIAELLGVSWTLLPIGFVLFYNKIGWKYINRHLDFAGYWDFEEEQSEWSGAHGEKHDYVAWGFMRILQDPRSIRMVEGQTHKGSSNELPSEVGRWWSIACELDAERGIITAALDHQSGIKRVGGAVKYGVEIITVTERNNRGLPIRMSSKVYHCIGHGKPRIVSCKYSRRSHQESRSARPSEPKGSS
jgi:hypothetical protein